MEDIRVFRKYYEGTRRDIVASIVSNCRICFDVAWTDYYGNYVCRDCCFFFVSSVFHREEYWCAVNGCCECDSVCKKKCKFCWLKTCFNSNLRSMCFAISWNGLRVENYLTKTKFCRERARVRNHYHREDFRRIRAFVECLDWNKSDIEELFRKSEIDLEFRVPDKIVKRFPVLLIIKNSINSNGNLMLKRCCMDPYKCRVLSLQNLMIEMLKIVEIFARRNISINMNSMKTLLNEDDLIISRRLNREGVEWSISNLDKLIENFQNEMIYYAQDILQRCVRNNQQKMDSIEGIEDYCSTRQEIAASVVSLCCICQGVAWTDYYDNYVCRECCYFFLNSISHRADYWCVANGNCECYDDSTKRNCSFCWLNTCYHSDLDSAVFGMNEREGSNYLRDTNSNRTRVPVYFPISRANFDRETRAFAECFDWNDLDPESIQELEDLSKLSGASHENIVARFVILSIVNTSTFKHGNLLLKNCYIDPYKCRLLSLQNLGIMMVELLMDFEELEFVLDAATREALLLYGVQGVLDDLDVGDFGPKILILERLVNNFKNEIIYYAHDFMQRL